MSLPDETTALPVGENFFALLADRLLEFHAENSVTTGYSADLSEILVFVPSMAVGAELRAALARASSAALLLPRFDMMKNWAFRAQIEDIPDPFPSSERIVLLYEALRIRDWFDEAARWEIASEISALFDEMGARSILLPEEESAFASCLEEAYAIRDSPPLTFEARTVYELWKTLNVSGVIDANLVYQRRLARIARDAGKNGHPLFVVLDAAPEDALSFAEREFLRRYAKHRPVRIFRPAPREALLTPLMRVLDAAWPQTPETPLCERAAAMAREFPRSPLAERLSILPAKGREAEAWAALAQIEEWLRQGLRKIALIAQDRLTTRRVRALLERQEILARDETGWKLSTSRAAATIDALLETAAENGCHRDVLDLCKSPYVFSDVDKGDRAAGVFAIETLIRRTSTQNGLLKMRRIAAGSDVPENVFALALIDRVIQAVSLVSGGAATLFEWLARLRGALEVLGAIAPLDRDAAGRALLKLLEDRQKELDASEALFSFGVWRAWLDREMESVNFRDETIESPIVLTPLKAAELRRFEAAIILGGDSRHLATDAAGFFFNDSARKALGLGTREDEENGLRRELEHLLAVVPRVIVTWRQDEESGALAPDFALLSSLHKLAWDDDLFGARLTPHPEPEADVDTAPANAASAFPSAPPDLIPERISASAYKALIACPYLFFARHVLRLGEMDEVREEMKKNDYGNFVHRVLEIFHTRHPLISVLGKDDARSALQSCVDEVFDPSILDDFPAIAWKMRWEKHLDAYLDWQRERETEGWRWACSEVKAVSTLDIENGKRLELRGRIDRIDRRSGFGDLKIPLVALLDYKTQKLKNVREYLEDDIQLALYAMIYDESIGRYLEGETDAGKVSPIPKETAYIALDDDKIATIRSGSEDFSIEEIVESQKERLIRIFGALYAGAKLPARGVSRVCAYCEMSGLCRRDHA